MLLNYVVGIVYVLKKHALCMLALVACLTSCSGQRPWPWSDSQEGNPHDRSGQAATSDTQRNSKRPISSGASHVFRMQFDVLRADFPKDSAKHSLKVWNHVDELRIDPDQIALLARNGVRVGAAAQGAQPALEAIFKVSGAKVLNSTQVIQGGMPLTVDLGVLESVHTLFRYDRTGRLAGKSIPPGEKLLHVEYLLHPELDGCVDANVVLELRHDRGSMEWVNVGGEIRQMPAYDHFRFDDLMAMLTLRKGEFLVIGPANTSDNNYLVGNSFFSRQISGQRFDSILCITPRPYSVKTESSAQ